MVLQLNEGSKKDQETSIKIRPKQQKSLLNFFKYILGVITISWVINKSYEPENEQLYYDRVHNIEFITECSNTQ